MDIHIKSNRWAEPQADVDYNKHGKNFHGYDGGFFPEAEIRSNIHRAQWNCSVQGHRWSNTQVKFCIECYIDKEL